MNGGIGLAFFKGRKTAHMALPGNGRGHAVNTAGKGPCVVQQAMVVIVQQGAAQFNLGGLLHDGFGTFAVFFCPVQFALDARGTAVKIGGALKNSRTLRPVTKGRFKSLVDVHGFDKRKIKKCVTAIATAFLADYALGKSPAHPAKKVVNFSPQCFIAGKNRAQIRDHGYPAIVRKTWGGIAGKTACAYENAARRVRAGRHNENFDGSASGCRRGTRAIPSFLQQ